MTIMQAILRGRFFFRKYAGGALAGTLSSSIPAFRHIYMYKDKQDEAQRHAQRNYVIKEVRNQLVTYQGYSFTDADVLIGRIWGLGERKIREIVRSESFSAVSADDLTKLAVSLHQILETRL